MKYFQYIRKSSFFEWLLNEDAQETDYGEHERQRHVSAREVGSEIDDISATNFRKYVIKYFRAMDIKIFILEEMADRTIKRKQQEIYMLQKRNKIMLKDMNYSPSYTFSIIS